MFCYDAPQKKVDFSASEYGLRAKEWMRKCIMLLPEIEKRGIWKKRGFGSIYEYAAKIAGMSRNNVNEALRVFEKIADKPELQKMVEMRGINAVKPVVTIATQETAAFWAEKAGKMSKNTLETYVREMKKMSFLTARLPAGRQARSPSAGLRVNSAECVFSAKRLKSDQESLQTKEVYRDPRSEAVARGDLSVEDDIVDPRRKQQNLKFPFGKFLVEDDSMKQSQGNLSVEDDTVSGLPRKAITMDIDPEIAEKLEKLKGQGSWNGLMKELLELREEKLKSEKPETVQTDSRYIPAKIKKHSLKKTRGTCAFPGCLKPYKILHHTKRFALTNEHEAETLQPLCKAHENLAHLGLIENEWKNPENWRLLRLPDLNHPAYEIDMAVQRFRQMAAISN